ncbi:hypothetical protein WA016_02160 [Myxococcus stipitatus]
MGGATKSNSTAARVSTYEGLTGEYEPHSLIVNCIGSVPSYEYAERLSTAACANPSKHLARARP